MIDKLSQTEIEDFNIRGGQLISRGEGFPIYMINS